MTVAIEGKSLELVIKRARLRDHADLVDLGIADGRIQVIEDSVQLPAATELDAQGNLVTESFVNAHLHLDKVYTQSMLDEAALGQYHSEGMGQAMSAIELAARVKERYDAGWIAENARRAVGLALHFGTTHMRAFADVDPQAKLEGVKALLQVREEFRGRVTIQVVAFPQDGVVREPGTARLVRQAMEMGADVVGGIPWIEYTDRNAQQHIDEMFAIAKDFNAPLSMLVDDAGDAGLRTLEFFAVKARDEGWQGRALAHHARAMALYPEPYFRKVAALLHAAGMGVVTDPHTGPLHARARDLVDAGVVVCLGQDDISDAYYPFGRNNMLEVAFLASHLLWLTGMADMDRLYDMITVSGAKAMGVTNFDLRVEAPANLVVLGAPSVLEALRNHEPPKHVISHGRLITAQV